MSLRELAEQIASWENDTSPAEITYQERRRVHNALRQYHLPKLADAGLVDYDPDERTVSLTEPARHHRFYLDVLPHRGLPWGLYYLVITTVAGGCLIGAVLGVPPATMLAPGQWVIFFGVVLWVSSIAHAYDNLYQMRLGRGDQPRDPDSP